uniref:Uncharacterized protein n=1 Tax=Strongyloides stercoralis TaxID=6248 RepID=A0AAF5DIV6_STRER
MNCGLKNIFNMIYMYVEKFFQSSTVLEILKTLNEKLFETDFNEIDALIIIFKEDIIQNRKFRNYKKQFLIFVLIIKYLKYLLSDVNSSNIYHKNRTIFQDLQVETITLIPLSNILLYLVPLHQISISNQIDMSSTDALFQKWMLEKFITTMMEFKEQLIYAAFNHTSERGSKLNRMLEFLMMQQRISSQKMLVPEINRNNFKNDVG